jgi:DNA-binding response OmpR family regulator
MSTKILVVDDDKKIVNLVTLYLKNEGYEVFGAYDGEEALDKAHRLQPDLIVLDLMLPKVDGLEICEVLRETSGVPIIMLTARTTEDDKLAGLKIGADDYVTKPFSPRELVARVAAVLRRGKANSPAQQNNLSFGSLVLDFVRHEARINGEVINLTPTEFKLLEAMAREPGRCFSRKALIDVVFGFDYDGLERTIDVHVMNLRKKLKAGGNQPVVTVPGLGYRFENEVI